MLVMKKVLTMANTARSGVDGSSDKIEDDDGRPRERQKEGTDALGREVKSEGVDKEGVEEEDRSLDQHLGGVEDDAEKKEFEMLIEGSKTSANG